MDSLRCGMRRFVTSPACMTMLRRCRVRNAWNATLGSLATIGGWCPRRWLSDARRNESALAKRMNRSFERADVVLTPMTGGPPPLITDFADQRSGPVAVQVERNRVRRDRGTRSTRRRVVGAQAPPAIGLLGGRLHPRSAGAFRVVEEQRTPDPTPTPPAGLDRQDRSAPVARLSTQRRTPLRVRRQRRRRQTRTRPMDQLGTPIRVSPRFVELQHRITTNRAAIDATLQCGSVQRAHRINKHQDPLTHPHRLRLPRTPTRHRSRNARPRRPPTPAPTTPPPTTPPPTELAGERHMCRSRMDLRSRDLSANVPASVPGWFAGEQLAPGIPAVVERRVFRRSIPAPVGVHVRKNESKGGIRLAFRGGGRHCVDDDTRVEANSVGLAVDRRGEGSPVLLVAGIGADGSMWAPRSPPCWKPGTARSRSTIAAFLHPMSRPRPTRSSRWPLTLPR